LLGIDEMAAAASTLRYLLPSLYVLRASGACCEEGGGNEEERGRSRLHSKGGVHGVSPGPAFIHRLQSGYIACGRTAMTRPRRYISCPDISVAASALAPAAMAGQVNEFVVGHGWCDPSATPRARAASPMLHRTKVNLQLCPSGADFVLQRRFGALLS
jgi:hypothetical protein